MKTGAPMLMVPNGHSDKKGRTSMSKHDKELDEKTKVTNAIQGIENYHKKEESVIDAIKKLENVSLYFYKLYDNDKFEFREPFKCTNCHVCGFMVFTKKFTENNISIPTRYSRCQCSCGTEQILFNLKDYDRMLEFDGILSDEKFEGFKRVLVKYGEYGINVTFGVTSGADFFGVL